MTQEDEAVISPFNLNDDNNNKINSKNENFLQNLNNILAAELNEDDKKKIPAITSNNNNQLLSSSNNNMEDEESDAYFKYIKSSSASSSSNLNRNQHHRQMMKTQKKSSSYKFNGHHPSPLSNMNNRKIFRVDKNLQRLEKKSWKIPIKTVALYKNVENQSPQKMVGELNELFDSFKNS